MPGESSSYVATAATCLHRSSVNSIKSCPRPATHKSDYPKAPQNSWSIRNTLRCYIKVWFFFFSCDLGCDPLISLTGHWFQGRHRTGRKYWEVSELFLRQLKFCITNYRFCLVLCYSYIYYGYYVGIYRSNVFWSDFADSGTHALQQKKPDLVRRCMKASWDTCQYEEHGGGGETGKHCWELQPHGGTIACPGRPCMQSQKWTFFPYLSTRWC